MSFNEKSCLKIKEANVDIVKKANLKDNILEQENIRDLIRTLEVVHALEKVKIHKNYENEKISCLYVQGCSWFRLNQLLFR